MRPEFILLITAIISLPLICVGCSSDDNPENIYMPGLVKTLPKMYIDKMEKDETRIINTQEEFDQLFTREDLNRYPDLIAFSPSRHTLLVGRYYYPYQVQLSHMLQQSRHTDFTYTLRILDTAATAIDDFIYGIIIEKLPENANVKFEFEYPYRNGN